MEVSFKDNCCNIDKAFELSCLLKSLSPKLILHKPFLLADLSTCGLGLGKALLTDAERGISDPGGGLRNSKELLLSFAAVAWNMIPVSLDAVSGTVNKNFT